MTKSETVAATEALLKKYRSERDKRIRADGPVQYRLVEGVLTDFDCDPYTPRFERAPVAETIDAVIIGAGLSGLMAAARLREQGVENIRILDKAGDFGGTWYWNRYPGAACDVESYIYMPFLEETGYMPTEKYAKAYEIFEHCQRIARHFDLYPSALFQTEITDLSWSDEESFWRVSTDRGDRIAARFAIVAGGVLHKAKLPGIPGIETFKGKSFHTARWDYAYTGGDPKRRMDKLGDKRVALIGTGATSVQVAPRLAETAQQLYVFQRTPAAVGRRDNRPTDPEWAASLKPEWQAKRMANFTNITSGRPADVDLVQDGWTEIFGRNPHAAAISTEEQQLVDLQLMNEIRDRVDAVVKDPATAEALKPWYNRMCKRPCFHDEYLQAFNAPNVKLVDTSGRGVERITENAIMVDGVSYPVDCIIYGSGFETGSTYSSRLGFEIHGRGGIAISEAWATGPETLYGIHARQFPNLIMFSITQAVAAINFTHVLSEIAIHAAWFIRRCLEQDVVEIEPSTAAQDEWFSRILSAMGERGQFYAECTPSYFNGEGATAAQLEAAAKFLAYFGPAQDYIDALHAWRASNSLDRMDVKRDPAKALA